MRLKGFAALCLLVLASGACLATSTLIRYQTADDFAGLTLTHARWDAQAGGVVFDGSVPGAPVGGIARGIIESPVVETPSGFDQAIASWNASTPPGSYISVYIRSRVNEIWTGWYNLGLWNLDNRPMHKTSFSKQKDLFGDVDTETLKLDKNADAFKIRLQLESSDGHTYPTVRFLGVNLNDATWQTDIPPVKQVWGTELDVPYLCQLSVPGGGVWCSPTSTAMVLGYWSKKLRRPDMKIGITQAATNVFDTDWGGTGNWSFNVDYAGEFPGMRAYVTRFTSVSQIEAWIAKGVPVITALNYSALNGNPNKDVGHLMVIRGFTKDGDPVFNDPWAHLEKGEKLRKVFTRQRLEEAWLGPKGSWGTVYIIYPEAVESGK
jgi:hypothetical protein